MTFKYYDLLATTIIGVLALSLIKFLWFETFAIDSIGLLAGGYVVGYFINTISSLLESFYFWTIRGIPSDVLLKPNSKHEWTGISKVKFYERKVVVDKLKTELKDNEASTGKMFACAQRHAASNKDGRVCDFNAQYAFSRNILTCTLLSFIITLPRFYSEWLYWVIGIITLLILWNRYRESGYYYAREVLNEYLNK